MKKVLGYEPWFFLFFGLFHLHRIWGLIDRASYADFWIGVLMKKGAFYFVLMGILAILCVLGIITFFRNRRHNDWWRWIYLFGGAYLIFDLVAIALEIEFWNKLLFWLFDVDSPYWNVIWGLFVGLGAFSLGLGVMLLKKRRTMKQV